MRVCLSAERAKNVSWPWLSQLRGRGSLTMAFTGNFVCTYIYIYIYNYNIYQKNIYIYIYIIHKYIIYINIIHAFQNPNEMMKYNNNISIPFYFLRAFTGYPYILVFSFYLFVYLTLYVISLS